MFKQILKKSKHFKIALVIAIILLLPSPFIFLFDIKIGIAWITFVFLLIIYLIYKKRIGQEMIIAILFALFITSYHTYIYSTINFTIGTINIFPLIMWTAGLVILREAYEISSIKFKLIVFSVIYLLILFIIEYIGYYHLGIRINGDYPSLLGTGIIHGPTIIHLFYVLAGPIYLLITDYLRVK